MKAVVEMLLSAKSAAILTHQRADPDALGSAAGMGMMLRHAGVSAVRVVLFDPAPPQYRFILALAEAAGVQASVWNAGSAAEIEAACDTIVVVDTCTFNQLEPAAEMLKRLKPRVLAVDHHLTRDNLGVVFADTSAAACAQILWTMLPALGVKPDTAIATALFSGLVADTGFFRFDSVTGQTLRAAAEMVEAGAKPAELYERLMQTEQPAKLALVARALQSVQWAAQNKVAIMSLTQQDFAQVGAVLSQTEGIVNWALDVATVEVAALLTEMPDGKIRGSLRSKHTIDVNAIAKAFNGGGHAKAAGLRLDGPMAAAQEKIIAAITAAFASQ